MPVKVKRLTVTGNSVSVKNRMEAARVRRVLRKLARVKVDASGVVTITDKKVATRVRRLKQQTQTADTEVNVVCINDINADVDVWCTEDTED